MVGLALPAAGRACGFSLLQDSQIDRPAAAQASRAAQKVARMLKIKDKEYEDGGVWACVPPLVPQRSVSA